MNKVSEYFSRFNNEYFFTVPGFSKVLYLQVGIYLSLIIISFALPRYLYSKKSDVYKNLIKNIFIANLILALTGLFLTFSRYELLPLFSWRFWQYLNTTFIIGLNVYFYLFSEKIYREKALNLLKKKRIEKWLPKGKKKK